MIFFNQAYCYFKLNDWIQARDIWSTKITDPFFKMLAEYNLCVIEYIDGLHEKGELMFEMIEDLQGCMRHFEWVMKRIIKISVS